VNGGGGLAIVGLNGEYLAGPLFEGEEVLVAEISLEDALLGKQVHNVLGHYTRWDVLSINFKRERLTPFKNDHDRETGPGDYSSEFEETRKKLGEVSEKLDILSQHLKLQTG
jgi:hypothetical protein